MLKFSSAEVCIVCNWQLTEGLHKFESSGKYNIESSIAKKYYFDNIYIYIF